MCLWVFHRVRETLINPARNIIIIITILLINFSTWHSRYIIYNGTRGGGMISRHRWTRRARGVGVVRDERVIIAKNNGGWGGLRGRVGTSWRRINAPCNFQFGRMTCIPPPTLSSSSSHVIYINNNNNSNIRLYIIICI